MTDNVLQPTYNAPSDQLTGPGSLKSSNEHPTISSEASTHVPSQNTPSQIREYHGPSDRQTDWTTLQSSKDDTTLPVTDTAASTPGAEFPGAFPRTTSDQPESATSAAGTWNATVNGLAELLPSRETVTNTLAAAQDTVQKTAQEYGPKAAEGVKGIAGTVAGYLPGSYPTFAQQGVSTPMPANEYGGAPFNRGLNSTNQVDAADLDQPQISDDAIAEAAQRLAKKGPLAGPEKPFSEPTRSQSDVLADKGEPEPRPTTHIATTGATSIPEDVRPHETTSHFSRVTTLPSRPHHMPPTFGTEQSDILLSLEVPPTPPAKDESQTLAKDADTVGVNDSKYQSTTSHASANDDPTTRPVQSGVNESKNQSATSQASANDDDSTRPVQSGVHLIPTQEHVLTGKTIAQSIDDASPTAAADSDYIEANHRMSSNPTERSPTHGQVAKQGSTASTTSSQSDGGKPKLKDRLRGEVKILTGKIKRDDELVQEGRRMMSPGSH